MHMAISLHSVMRWSVVAGAGIAMSAFAQMGDPILTQRDYLGTCGQMLFDPDGFERDRFGGSIASDGEWLLIGSWGDDTACPFDPICTAGSAYFFRRMPDGRYIQWQKVVPDDIARRDAMGIDVAIQGATAMVYRGGKPLGPSAKAGEILLYKLEGGRWAPDGIILSGGPMQSYGFGAGFELAGDMLAAATSYVDTDGRILSGVIELFRNIDGVWTYLDTVYDPLGRFRAQWIDELALLPDGTLAVTDWQDSSAYTLSGIVRVFEPDEERWELTQELFSPDGEPFYGFRVDADAGRIAVGHISGVSGPGTSGVLGGRVDIYERGPDAWERTHAVAMDAALHGDGFGDRIALDGDRLLSLASFRPTTEPFEHEGVWTIFDFDGSAWRETLASPGPPWPLRVDSIRVELDGDTALIGHELWTPEPGLVGVGSVFAYDIACLSCEADLDADGSLTIFDFLTFMNLFDAGDPIADFDGDGELTIFDFLAFQNEFDAGCE